MTKTVAPINISFFGLSHMMHGAILAPVLERLTLSILQLIPNHQASQKCHLVSVSPDCNTPRLADPSADKEKSYLDPRELRTLELLVSDALPTAFCTKLRYCHEPRHLLKRRPCAKALRLPSFHSVGALGSLPLQWPARRILGFPGARAVLTISEKV